MSKKRKYDMYVAGKIDTGKDWTYHLNLNEDRQVAKALMEHKQLTLIPYSKTILTALRQYLLP